MYKNIQPTRRRGAALIIVLVLLACLTMVAALESPRTFPCRLDSRKQQRNQHADDGNHDQKFKEGKGSAFHGCEGWFIA